MDKIVTLKSFCDRYHETFTLAAMRSLLFYADENGLDKSGAVFRLGSKVYIDTELFAAWMKSGQKPVGKRGKHPHVKKQAEAAKGEV
jgi:hypothetical protein